MHKEIVLVALGGNAILKESEFGTVTQQFANTRHALEGVVEVVKHGARLVLTHGNGPQVGNLLIRVEAARDRAYDVPLGVCVAQSQGEMGYMIGQSLQNHLELQGLYREVVTVLTQVVVAKDDPSMLHPTKPIGPFYQEDQARKLQAQGLILVEDSGRGFRRVVPSPRPLSVVEGPVIRALVSLGIIVIAAGGGGMPVYVEPDGRYEGVDGVVDKDLASAILATEVGAQRMVILTGVDKVFLDFRKPTARAVDQLTASEARGHLRDGQFPPGSMGPKILAAVEFIERGGEAVIISSAESFAAAWNRDGGTWIVRG